MVHNIKTPSDIIKMRSGNGIKSQKNINGVGELRTYDKYTGFDKLRKEKNQKLK